MSVSVMDVIADPIDGTARKRLLDMCRKIKCT